MTSRGFVIGLALLLAVAATAAVAIYVRNVEESSEAAETQVQVIVAKQDIIAGENLDELLSRGAFQTESVTEDSLVDGAVTSLDELEGKTTSSPIVEGEQITTARLEGSGELPGGALGIPAGHTAVNIALPSPSILGGNLTTGDHVTVFAHFSDNAQATAQVTQQTQGAVTATVNGGQGMTVTLVPDVQVLKVQGEVPSGGNGTIGANQKFTDVELAVTLALKPRDAEKLIHAKSQGQIHLALLPPGEKGDKQRPLTTNEVIGR